VSRLALVVIGSIPGKGSQRFLIGHWTSLIAGQIRRRYLFLTCVIYS
jgi:hypothetical protein